MGSQTFTIIELAKKFDIDTPDFIDCYQNQIEDIGVSDITDIRQNVEFYYFQDSVSEYADNNTPIYYSDIDTEYAKCSFTIDDVISEGLCEAMESEADISKAKQIALYMQIEIDTYAEIEDFIVDLQNEIDNCEDMETFECLNCQGEFFKFEDIDKNGHCENCEAEE